MRALLEGLGVSEDIAVFEINPEGYDNLAIGSTRFAYPAGRAALEDSLCARFFTQRKGIAAYLDIVERLYSEFPGLARFERKVDAVKIPFLAPTAARYGFRSAESVVGDFVDNPHCAATLLGQCGDYGVLPARAPFLMHGAVAGHYLNGAHHPMGGGAGFVKGFTRGLRRHGATISTNAKVNRILVERGRTGLRAVGARLANGTSLRADCVVSNADPQVTYDLVGHERLSPLLRARLHATGWSRSALSLFAVVDYDLRGAGLHSGNFWLRNSFSPADIFPDANELHFGERPLPLVVTAGTLKDPSSFGGRYHAIEAFTFVDFSPFERWQGSETGARAADYERWKKKLSDRMIAMIETVAPGIGKRVVHSTLGTPLTNVSYVNATRGAVYGTEKTRFNMGPFGFTSQSEIEGLSLCGASTFGHGVINALQSGLRSAANILGCSVDELLREKGPALTSHSAEHWSATQPAESHAVPASESLRRAEVLA